MHEDRGWRWTRSTWAQLADNTCAASTSVTGQCAFGLCSVALHTCISLHAYALHYRLTIKSIANALRHMHAAWHMYAPHARARLRLLPMCCAAAGAVKTNVVRPRHGVRSGRCPHGSLNLRRRPCCGSQAHPARCAACLALTAQCAAHNPCSVRRLFPESHRSFCSPARGDDMLDREAMDLWQAL